MTHNYALLLIAALALVLVLLTRNDGDILSRVRKGKFQRDNLDMNFGKESTRHLSQQEPNNLRELPYFILHVGPKKTGMYMFLFTKKEKVSSLYSFISNIGCKGTTSIQSLLDSEQFKRILQKDNYVFIGSGIGKNKGVLDDSKPIYHTDSNHDTLELSSDLVQKVKQLRQSRTNIIASSEYLGTMQECWRQLLFPEDTDQQWNVQIVVTYRRFFSYLPSDWNQHYKVYRINNEGRPKLPRHFNWPGINGDYEIQSFVDWFDTKHYQGGKKEPGHLAKRNYDSWTKLSSKANVRIVSLYEEGGLVENFVCQAMVGAKHACNTLKSPSSNTSTEMGAIRLLNANESINLDHDILAVHAYQKGLVNKKFTRVQVANAVELQAQSLDEEGIQYFQSCLNNDMTRFLRRWSLEYEEWALRKLPGEIEFISDLTDFNNDWLSVLKSNKLCSIDAEKTLAMQPWKDFFAKNFN